MDYIVSYVENNCNEENIDEKEEIMNLFIPNIVYTNPFLRIQKVHLSDDERFKIFNNFYNIKWKLKDKHNLNDYFTTNDIESLNNKLKILSERRIK